MDRTSSTLREARAHAGLATLAALVAATGAGAGAHLTAGPVVGLTVGTLTAAAGIGAVVGTIRLRVTRG